EVAIALHIRSTEGTVTRKSPKNKTATDRLTGKSHSFNIVLIVNPANGPRLPGNDMIYPTSIFKFFISQPISPITTNNPFFTKLVIGFKTQTQSMPLHIIIGI